VPNLPKLQRIIQVVKFEIEEKKNRMPHPKFKSSKCSNCGTRLLVSNNYCPQCGQVNHNLNIPLKYLIEEAAESIFHFDTKSVRTLKAICFKPGFITSEFIKGRRAQYVAPVKFYIFISFVFFLIISLPQVKQGTSPDVDMKVDTLTYDGISSAELRGVTKQVQLDSVMQAHAIQPSPLNRYIIRQLSRLGTEGQEAFNHMLLKSVSYMMFALMPLFALFIFILHFKKTKHYISTLVFSIHYHSFVFLLLTLSCIVDRIASTFIIFIVPTALSPIYLFMALRCVYGDSFPWTIVKTIIVGALQFLSIGLLFVATVIIALLIF
jgi:hypothetical protein